MSSEETHALWKEHALLLERFEAEGMNGLDAYVKARVIMKPKYLKLMMEERRHEVEWIA